MIRAKSDPHMKGQGYIGKKMLKHVSAIARQVHETVHEVFSTDGRIQYVHAHR